MVENHPKDHTKPFLEYPTILNLGGVYGFESFARECYLLKCYATIERAIMRTPFLHTLHPATLPLLPLHLVPSSFGYSLKQTPAMKLSPNCFTPGLSPASHCCKVYNRTRFIHTVKPLAPLFLSAEGLHFFNPGAVNLLERLSFPIK